MNDYIGKTCPYCRAELKEGDDIVVCSCCEMPHHKDCWIENRGCTTFGCTGTIQGISGAYQPQYPPLQSQQPQIPSTAEFIFCRKCGQRGRRTDIFCSKCGTRHIIPAASGSIGRDPVPLVTLIGVPAYPVGQAGGVGSGTPSAPAYSAGSGYTAPASYSAAPAPSHAASAYSTPGIYPAPAAYMPSAQVPLTQTPGAYSAPYSSGIPLNTDTNRDENLFIDSNAQYFRRKFNAMDNSGSTASWNWCSFLFAPYWFLYRKMYVIGSILAAVTALCVLIPYADLVLLAISITAGILGNYLYKRHITAKLGKLHSYTPEARNFAIVRSGGVDIAASILGAVAVIIAAALIYSATLE